VWRASVNSNATEDTLGRNAMIRSRFSEERITYDLCQAEKGAGVGDAMFYV